MMQKGRTDIKLASMPITIFGKPVKSGSLDMGLYEFVGRGCAMEVRVIDTHNDCLTPMTTAQSMCNLCPLRQPPNQVSAS